MKIIYTIAFVLLNILISSAQIGINVPGDPPIPHASAELEVYSTNKGILIPRIDNAAMDAILPSGAADEGLMVFNTTHNAFFYYNGFAWIEIGGSCNVLQDTDGDTKVEVEQSPDEDIIRFTANGTEVLRIEETGVIHTTGNLTTKNGTFVFGTEYSLPLEDGNDGYALGVDNSDNVVWRNPSAALGLVVGIETSSFANVMATHNVDNNAYFVRVMPWSDIKVTQMAFLLDGSVGNIRPQLGIYNENLDRLGVATSDIITGPASFGIIEIPLETGVTLEAGKVYWFAIMDMLNGDMGAWRYTAASGSEFSTWMQPSLTELPEPAVYGATSDKGYWIAAY